MSERDGFGEAESTADDAESVTDGTESVTDTLVAARPTAGDGDRALDGDDDSEPENDDYRDDGPTKVAIACQGGGSHTAFTAGVLTEVLANFENYELVGISGTSGGAINAVAAWYGLVTEDEERAIELLEAIWADLRADGFADRLVNQWVVGVSRLEEAGVPITRFSPYHHQGSDLASERLTDVLEGHLAFDELPSLCERNTPELVVGTVDVEDGEFDTFVNEGVTPEAVLASAAVPNLFEAVEVDGTLHWDGLFSQNPPIDDLLTVPSDRKPEELWVIQINPPSRSGEPTTLAEIATRRNELAGNLSLHQELRSIRRVNEWIDQGYLPEEDFQRVAVRRIGIERDLHCCSKLDRSAAFVDELLEHGRSQARGFLAER